MKDEHGKAVSVDARCYIREEGEDGKSRLIFGIVTNVSKEDCVVRVYDYGNIHSKTVSNVLLSTGTGV